MTNTTLSTNPRPARSQRSALARLALPIAVTALALSACNIDIDLDEESVSQTFDLETFNSIEIDAPFEVTVRQGETQRVVVEVGESLVDDLVVEVRDGELHIDLDSSSFNIGRSLVATITVTDLESLHASSAADVVIVDLDVDDLEVQTDEASQLGVSGTIETLDLDMSEASQADFNGTTIETVDLDMSEASQADFDGATVGTVTLEMSGASSAEFPATVDAINGSIRSASSLDVDDATAVRVDTSSAASIDRN